MLAASNRERDVTALRPSIRQSVPPAYTRGSPEGSMRCGQCTFRPDILVWFVLLNRLAKINMQVPQDGQ